MTEWMEFFTEYLEYLEVPYEISGNLIKTKIPHGEGTLEAEYCFSADDHRPGVLGFFQGTDLFYNVLEGCLKRGAWVTAYLTKNRFVIPEAPFVPYLFLNLHAVSPAACAPRKNYSLLINLCTGDLLDDPPLKSYRQIAKDRSLPRALSYKAALQKGLEYIKKDLASQTGWLEESKKNRESFLANLKRAGLTEAEERTRSGEARARLSPHFEVHVRLLGRLFIK